MHWQCFVAGTSIAETNKVKKAKVRPAVDSLYAQKHESCIGDAVDLDEI